MGKGEREKRPKDLDKTEQEKAKKCEQQKQLKKAEQNKKQAKRKRSWDKRNKWRV